MKDYNSMFERVSVDVPDCFSDTVVTDEYLGLPFYTNKWKDGISNDFESTSSRGFDEPDSDFSSRRSNTI